MFLKTLLLFHVIYIYGRNIFPFITRSFRFNETTDIDEISLLFIVVLWMHKKRSALDTPFSFGFIQSTRRIEKRTLTTKTKINSQS